MEDYKVGLEKEFKEIDSSQCDFSNQDNGYRYIVVDNTYIWILAITPIIGALFSIGLFMFLIFNIGLCYIDENKLNKQGIETSQLGNTWFIPTYLYRRAEMFNHSKAYFITWCITFLISCLQFVLIYKYLGGFLNGISKKII